MNRRALARAAAGAKAAAPLASDADPSVGVENVSRKLEAQLAAGDLYGALQMYKTLFMRHLKGDAPDATQQLHAVELALEAALCLVRHQQSTAAAEMASLMLSVYADFHFAVDEPNKGAQANGWLWL